MIFSSLFIIDDNTTSSTPHRATSSRKLHQTIRSRYDKLLGACEFLKKHEITPLDLKGGHDFSKTTNNKLSANGVNLKARVNLSLSFCNSWLVVWNVRQLQIPLGKSLG